MPELPVSTRAPVYLAFFFLFLRSGQVYSLGFNDEHNDKDRTVIRNAVLPAETNLLGHRFSIDGTGPQVGFLDTGTREDRRA